MKFCHEPIKGRSRYEALIGRRCVAERGHTGPHSEFPYLTHFNMVAPRVAAKIKRDATKTTGASWKSDDAGPNRIDRWVMLLPNAELKNDFGIDIGSMKPAVQAKLREKAASYDDCMDVAAKLTWSAYQMQNSPEPTAAIGDYLSRRFGALQPNSTRCIVCRERLDFSHFEGAQRGRALLETAHSNPRQHSSDNVGFAHRDCNIAQGGKSLDAFYDWIRGILQRVDAQVSADVDAQGSHSSTSAPN